jgi:uncharacterized damage-inducible protein DinB
MKELLLRLLRYNAWANARFIEVLQTLYEEQLDQEIVSSFSSVRKTVYHMWGAEDIWLQRLQRVEKPVWKVFTFEGSFQEACANWKASSEALAAYVVTLSEDMFQQTIPVVNMKGELHDDMIGDVLQHICSHAAYHRGQLVTMLRQLGITTIPATDFIAYCRAMKTVEA